MPPEILICIEHVARELDIACAVHYLAQREHGLQVYVSSLTSLPRRDIRPRVIAVPYFLAADDFGLPALTSTYPGTPLVNLAFEQVLFRANARFKRPRDRIAKRHVFHLSSGHFFHRHLLHAGVHPSNIRTIGSLPCALYREPYRRYFRIPREVLAQRYQLDPAKPWVFFPENFGAAFFKDSQIRHRARRGFDEQALRTYRQFSRDSFAQIMQWCATAAEQGNAELILRPRPATPQQEFIARFAEVTRRKQVKGLHFIKDGSVREWILGSQAVVSSFSTCLLEAAVAGKPAFLLAPQDIPDCLRSDWIDYAPRVQDKGQFVELLCNPGGGHSSHSLPKWARSTLLGQGDPIRNVVQLLSEICSGRIPVCAPPRPSWLARTRRSVYDATKTLERTIRGAVRGRSRASRLHEHDQILPDDVNRRVSRWAEILGGGDRASAA